MDKKYKHIVYRTKQELFKDYLRQIINDDNTWNLLLEVSTLTDVFIFSGVIRNYFLNIKSNRDLDIVLSDISKITLPTTYPTNLYIRKNSFGGYKIKIGKLTVDVWDIRETWGIKNLHLQSTPENLIKTSFFNFSSIVYDFNNAEFIYDNIFENFRNSRTIDITYKVNPNIPLCIINTLYYSFKYSLPIKYRLCKWLKINYKNNFNFRKVQLAHFNRIIFSTNNIIFLMTKLEYMLPELKKRNGAILLVKSKTTNYDITISK